LREYRDGTISRREFIHRAVVLTGSLAAATTLVDSLLAATAHGAQVEPNDPGLKSGDLQYPGKAGPVLAYLSRPSAAGKYPAIIVISDNAGLVDHFRDIARRYAKEGYVALVPDVFSRHGGTAKVNPKGAGVKNFRELAPLDAVTEDIDAGFSYLKGLPEVRGDRLGLTGFCWGGEMIFGAATHVRGLSAVVVFYGRSPQPLDLVKNIEAPLLVHYAEEDPEITNAVPATEEAMKKYNKAYTYKIFPGAKHAFFHDGRADRYNPEAAKEAWSRTLEFFKKHLQS
ncbi:MAG TPA: dienelactone hydrolase family protein, partial [Candidatus Binatia bacterium]|nr:dienelactone hydrolase family protein [Candidatus Binatia bacterium]